MQRENRKFYDSFGKEALGDLVENEGYLMHIDHENRDVSGVYLGYLESVDRDVFASVDLGNNIRDFYLARDERPKDSKISSVPFISVEKYEPRLEDNWIKERVDRFNRD